MTEPVAGSMADLLGKVTTFFTSLVSWIPQLITLITGNDYLLIGFVIVVVSFVVGLLVRLVSKLGHAAR